MMLRMLWDDSFHVICTFWGKISMYVPRLHIHCMDLCYFYWQWKNYYIRYFPLHWQKYYFLPETLSRLTSDSSVSIRKQWTMWNIKNRKENLNSFSRVENLYSMLNSNNLFRKSFWILIGFLVINLKLHQMNISYQVPSVQMPDCRLPLEFWWLTSDHSGYL